MLLSATECYRVHGECSVSATECTGSARGVLCECSVSATECYGRLTRSGRTLLGTPPAPLSPSLLLGGGSDPPSSSRRHWTQLSRLFAAAAPSHLGSCFSGTLEAAVFTAPSSPIHLRRVECWRFTKDLWTM